MKVAIDVSPLTSGNFLQHRVRGTGFYLNNLKENLLKYHSDASFAFFNRGEKVSADVIHYPYFEPFFLTLPSNVDSNTVVTVHDLTPLVFKKEFPSGIKGNIRWQIQKKRLAKSGAIVTDSESSKKDIHKYTKIDNSKIHVIYLAAASYFAVISEEKKKKIIKKLDLPEKFILYVGDATWNKNLSSLIEAVGNTNYHLVVAGEAFTSQSIDKNNPWNKDLVRAQKLAKENKRIIPTGFLQNEDLVALYNAAQLFIMPSIYEGFGLPVLEAMRCGCPVVTTKNGSLREVAGDAAYFVNPNDLGSITRGIVEVFESQRIREQLTRNGFDQAKKFSWEKTANETFSVYKKVLNE